MKNPFSLLTVMTIYLQTEDKHKKSPILTFVAALPDSTCAAVEVMQYDYFAGSARARKFRANVKYRYDRRKKS
jgi:hypothetical protein